MEMVTPPEKKKKKKVKEKKHPIKDFRELLISAVKRRKSEPLELFFDLCVLVVGFVFARCHLIFGAHPLAPAFIAVLPSRVWLASFGAVVGSLTLGKSGIIYSMVCAIVVFLRIIVSGTEKDIKNDDGEVLESERTALFGESTLLKMSSSLIAGFIAGVYEILLSGFTLTTVAFSVSMILIPPLLTFALSGLFNTGVDFGEIFKSDLPVLSTENKNEKDKYNIIFFEASALLLLFLISLSLAKYVFLGISLAYIFSSAVTLYTCRRFGSFVGAFAGFSAALGLSSSYSVAFALSGLVSAVLFNFKIIWGLVGGAIVLALWCFYAGGLSGLLTATPEYLIAACIMYPVLNKIKAERSEKEIENTEKSAEDMVGTMALAYKNNYKSSLDTLVSSLQSISSIIEKYRGNSLKPTQSEINELFTDCYIKYSENLDTGSDLENLKFEFSKENGNGEITFPKVFELSQENIDNLSNILYKNGKLENEDLIREVGACHDYNDFCDTVNREVANLGKEKYMAFLKESSSDDINYIGKLINEGQLSDLREKSVDKLKTEKLEESILNIGVSNFVVKVFGEREKHIIFAMEDESGTTITSKNLRDVMENTICGRLTAPEYYRKGKMALMECSLTKSFMAECAVATMTGEKDDISGDVAKSFESKTNYFYSLISDGMGSGSEAREVSTFVAEYLTRALDNVTSAKETVMRMLNNALRKGNRECSSTVDLFSLDLLLGEAEFIKSGSAPSYIKRENSIFRIRSKTAPLGLLRELDAEKIKVDIKSGDYVIMLSDGINQTGEDAPWLLELLSKPPKENLQDYADYLLENALRYVDRTDDMTVSVTKISKIQNG